LREIEEQYPNDVVVIGVHSGKYIAERETARIRDASLRYQILHPIVNDRQFRIWRSYAVRAWPTVVVIDRNRYVVGAHAGEFTAEMFRPVLDSLVAMEPPPGAVVTPHFPVEPPVPEPGQLRYPGKVAIEGTRIAIADTGNGRVLVGDLESEARMRIDRSITELKPRNENPGAPRTFHSPQGLTFADGVLYAADAENHIVCRIDPGSEVAQILAGTGDQMRTRADRDNGALSSPWDLVVIDGTIYVAMAGVHQLWSIDAATGKTRVHSGTGGEDIRDGPLAEALRAQPMGTATDAKRLYFADAESSALRWADIGAKGSVGTIVGTGLFDFGDADGIGDEVRMQHQQGLAVRGDELLTADSYNDALKWVNIETREARTWLRGFHEPGGVAVADQHAYVADTNAHRVVVADLRTGEMQTLEIVS
jgi:hypothetical protein